MNHIGGRYLIPITDYSVTRQAFNATVYKYMASNLPVLWIRRLFFIIYQNDPMGEKGRIPTYPSGYNYGKENDINATVELSGEKFTTQSGTASVPPEVTQIHLLNPGPVKKISYRTKFSSTGSSLSLQSNAAGCQVGAWKAIHFKEKRLRRMSTQSKGFTAGMHCLLPLLTCPANNVCGDERFPLLSSFLPSQHHTHSCE